MTKEGLTELVLIVDRSGSMGSSIREFEVALQGFLDNQRNVPGKTVVTLVQFDGVIENVFDERPLSEVQNLRFYPRGSTALLDAMGLTITRVGGRLSSREESERPEHVTVVIITDGYENSSSEYTKAQVRELIAHQTSVYNWNFLYLGANQDAIAEGAALGLTKDQTLTFALDEQSLRGAVNTLSAASASYSVGATYNITQEEREAAVAGS